MADGMTKLEQRINQFETALAELRQAVSEGHIVLKDLKAERKEIEKLFDKEARKIVNDRVDKVVRSELEKIGPEVKKQTHLIYTKVGDQIDKVIALSLGKEFATRKGKQDLRPQLAIKLREWIEEIIAEEEKNEKPTEDTESSGEPA